MDGPGQKPDLGKALLFIGPAGRLAALSDLREALDRRGYACRSVRTGGPAGAIAGILARPWQGPAAWARLWSWRRSGIGRLLIACPWQFTRYVRAARFFGLGIHRLVLPDEDLAEPAARQALKAQKRAGGALVSFCRRQDERLLSAGLEPADLARVPLGVKANDKARQETIFSRLAAHPEERGYKKFFTVGTVCPLTEARPVEIILQAAAQVRNVVANLQLIIIGDGPEKKNLSWLAKKLGLGDLAWFVGGQSVLGKWLENLDAYIAAGEGRAWPELAAGLKAAALARPLIVPEGSPLDAIFPAGTESLAVPPGKSEELAQAVIRLRQDKRLAESLGRAARRKAESEHTVERMADRFVEIMQKSNLKNQNDK